MSWEILDPLRILQGLVLLLALWYGWVIWRIAAGKNDGDLK